MQVRPHLVHSLSLSLWEAWSDFGAKQGGGSNDKPSDWPTDQNSQTVNPPDKLTEAEREADIRTSAAPEEVLISLSFDYLLYTQGLNGI